MLDPGDLSRSIERVGAEAIGKPRLLRLLNTLDNVPRLERKHGGCTIGIRGITFGKCMAQISHDNTCEGGVAFVGIRSWFRLSHLTS